jgi:tetratricopeptide (TPR) repeat protein
MALTPVANSVFYREALEDFPEAAFLKFLLRNPVVEKRYYKGELLPQVLEQLYAAVGGAPRFLEQVRKVLETASSAELQQELAAFTPSTAGPGSLQERRDRYCEQIFAGRLYSYLSLESRQALSRAAVYGVPVDIDGLRAVSGQEIDRLVGMTREWQEYALVYAKGPQGTVSELWTVYGVLRGWLLAEKRINLQHRKEAHRAAGDFLAKVESDDREKEFGLSTLECLQEARTQYLAADDYQQARGITDRFSGILVRGGLYREVIRLNKDLLELEKHPGSMTWVARAYLEQSNYQQASQWYEQGLTSADTYPREAAAAWHGLATIDMRTGDYQSAREKFEKSLLIKQQIGDMAGDMAGEASSLHQLASIDMATGDYQSAREKFEKSLLIVQQTGNRAGEASSWHQLASIDMETGDYLSAREKFRKSLLIEQQIGNRAGETSSLHQLASIDIATGDYPSARERFRKSLLIHQQIGNKAGEASSLHQLASIDIATEDYPSAREKSQTSLLIQQQIGNRAGESSSLHQLGSIDMATRDYPSAREKFEKSLLINQQIGDKAGEASSLHQLASIDLETGDYPSAREKFRKSLLINQQIGNKAEEAASFSQLGALARQMKHSHGAATLLGVCYLLDRAIGHRDTKSDLQALETVAAGSGLGPEDLQSLLSGVEEAYQQDRGWGLIKAAFEDNPDLIDDKPGVQ